MANRSDPQVWDRLIVEWQATTQSKAKFCQEHGIKPHQLEYQIYKRQDKGKGLVPTMSGFVRVKTPTASSVRAMEISIDHRIAIRVCDLPDPAWVASIVREVLKH